MNCACPICSSQQRSTLLTFLDGWLESNHSLEQIQKLLEEDGIDISIRALRSHLEATGATENRSMPPSYHVVEVDERESFDLKAALEAVTGLDFLPTPTAAAAIELIQSIQLQTYLRMNLHLLRLTTDRDEKALHDDKQIDRALNQVFKMTNVLCKTASIHLYSNRAAAMQIILQNELNIPIEERLPEIEDK